MTGQAKSNIGKKFPAIRANSLAKKPVSIPEAASGRVALIAVAFLRESQQQLDSWLGPFTKNFENRAEFTFYEVPMIASVYKLMRLVIDNGMRAGIPHNKHDHVVTMYGDVKKYLNELDLDSRTGYAFLLDKVGIIRWQGRGYSTPQSLRELFELAERLGRS